MASLFSEKDSGDVLMWDMGDFASKLVRMKKPKNQLEVVEYKMVAHGDADIAVNMEAVAQEMKEMQGCQVSLMVPLSISKARVVQEERMRKIGSSRISSNEEKAILESCMAAAKKILAEEWKASGILAEELAFPCCETSNMVIDGYAVPRLQGFQGTRIQVSCLVVGMPVAYAERIEQFFKRGMIKRHQIVHEAQMMRRFAKRAMLSGIYGDVGERATQIFIIREGNLSYVKEFPRGAAVATQLLERELHMEEAAVVKQQYAQRHRDISEERRQMIHGVLLPEARLWAEDLRAIVHAAAPYSSNAVSLFGGGSMIPEISETMEQTSLVYPQDIIPQLSLPHDCTWTPVAILSRFAYEQETR
ncbi:MAG: hypothetical protein Q7R48_00710 [bacterium]|nr:hypothetical protein [bacterium]